VVRDNWEMEQMILEANVQNGRQRLRLSKRRNLSCLSSRTARTGKVSSRSLLLKYHPSELPRWAQCRSYSRTIRQNCHDKLNVTVTHIIRQNWHGALTHGFYIKHLDTLQTDNTTCERLTGRNEIVCAGLTANCLYWFHFFQLDTLHTEEMFPHEYIEHNLNIYRCEKCFLLKV
jgi:hypothetical protein